MVAEDVGDAIRIDDLRGIKIPYYDGNPSNLDDFILDWEDFAEEVVLGRRVRAFIRGFLGLDWQYTPFTRSPHIYFIVVYLFRSADGVSLSLIPLVHVVDQEETGYGVGHRL